MKKKKIDGNKQKQKQKQEERNLTVNVLCEN